MKWLLVFGTIMMLLSGCAETSQNESAPSPQNERVRVNQTAPDQSANANNGKVAERLENLAESVTQVKSATVVVMGDVAVVGIDVDDELDASRVSTIKYSVAEALNKDPQGKNAIVTADMDLSERIRNIRDSIGNGKPVSGFADQLSDIVGRIMPQLPQDTTGQGSDEVEPKLSPRQTANPGEHPH